MSYYLFIKGIIIYALYTSSGTINSEKVHALCFVLFRTKSKPLRDDGDNVLTEPIKNQIPIIIKIACSICCSCNQEQGCER